ncbi:MAG: tetratricopeptide repeat protein [Terriglobia bacterium]
MPRLVLRKRAHVGALLLAGGALLGASASGIASALVAGAAGTAQERAALERAVRWQPDHAFYWYRLARWEEFSLEGDLNRALEHYWHATELNPHESRYWLDLADALALAGQPATAQASLARALEVAPRTARVLWRAGNFWLRAGEPERAFPSFRQALLADPSLVFPVVESCDRAVADPARVLREAVPRQASMRSAYLQYLVLQKDLPPAATVWRLLTELGEPFEIEPVLPYLDELILAEQPEAAAAAWADLHALELLPGQPGDGGEKLYNASLGAPLLNRGFDWRVHETAGVWVTRGAGRAGDSARALVVHFAGEKNLHYRHFFQYVPVAPNTRYRFAAWMKAEEITTDSGPRLEVADAYATQAPLSRSADLQGTTDWQRVEVEHTTGPGVRLLRVGLVRLPSERLGGEIRGTLRAAGFSLRAVEP